MAPNFELVRCGAQLFPTYRPRTHSHLPPARYALAQLRYKRYGFVQGTIFSLRTDRYVLFTALYDIFEGIISSIFGLHDSHITHL